MEINIREQKKFEASLTALEALRAIYIDFEGFMDLPPTFIGVRIDNQFNQLIFDRDLELAAKSHNLEIVDGGKYLDLLVKKARTENRRIIGFSSHEKTVLQDFFQLDIKDLYADARLLAKFLRKTVLKNVEKKPKDLTSYLYALNYPKQDNAIKKTTSRIAAVKKMLISRRLKYGELAFEECTSVIKSKWTKVLNHNNDDVNGMAFLVNLYIEESNRLK
jgi:hypothetical protein